MTSYPWYLRLINNKWEQIGGPAQPAKVRLKKIKAWMTFGDGDGAPLRARGGHKEWVQISTQGSHTGVLFGNCSEFESGIALSNKEIRVNTTLGRFTTRTDINGDYKITGLPLGSWTVYAYRLYPSIYIASINPVTFTHDDPIQMLNFFFPPGIWTNRYAFGFGRFNPTSIGDIVSQSFLYDVGWTATHHKQYESWTFYGGNHTFEQPDQYTQNSISIMQAHTLSQTGWIGDEALTHTREIDENVSWYSIPVGMLMEGEESANLIDQINAKSAGTESWTLTAELARIDIKYHLHGWSVVKDRKNSMPSFYWPDTTTGLYNGVGAIRMQGTTPTSTYDENGNEISTMVSVLYNNGRGINLPYSIPVVKNHEFAHEDGIVIWTGDLNSLGSTTGEHGLPIQELIVTQSVDPFDVDDYTTAFQVHFQVSGLPDPQAIDSLFRIDHAWAIQNFLSCWIEVDFVYNFV